MFMHRKFVKIQSFALEILHRDPECLNIRKRAKSRNCELSWWSEAKYYRSSVYYRLSGRYKVPVSCIDSTFTPLISTPVYIVLQCKERARGRERAISVYSVYECRHTLFTHRYTPTNNATLTFRCSVDPYLFENFETVNGHFLSAKFRAFKFPESSYVQFHGTVTVCVGKCRGVSQFLQLPFYTITLFIHYCMFILSDNVLVLV